MEANMIDLAVREIKSKPVEIQLNFITQLIGALPKSVPRARRLLSTEENVATLRRASTNRKIQAKPFLKWAGGKSQLLTEISKYYPFDKGSAITKYAEPFVGGGAVLFDILNKYTLDAVYISDVNKDLIDTYLAIRDDVDELTHSLKEIERAYLALDEDERRQMYLSKRERFNELKKADAKKPSTEKSALMIFLNKTCFNGLYRVNKKGDFNVPTGKYKKPKICDATNLQATSRLLKSVEIKCCSYEMSAEFIDDKTFVYLDPPYRPLTATANFTSYTRELFNDSDQLKLAQFVQELDKKGAKVVVSNSDPKNIDQNDDFFDKAYANQHIKRILATRMINRNGSARGKINELLISNFNN